MNKIEVTKAETKIWMNWNSLMILDQLKLIWHQFRDEEFFIRFPKSLRSLKSKFGAKSYAQNTRTGPYEQCQSGPDE